MSTLNPKRLKFILSFNNFLFAIQLSSVGIVILQMINTVNIAPDQASLLEPFKDVPIALTSFFLASLVPSWGYKRTMMVSLFLVIIASIIMAMTGEFFHAKLFFLLSGAGFGLFKVAGYPLIGFISKDSSDHASFMSILEAMFMVGVLSGFFLFGFMIELSSTSDILKWTDIYWILATLSILALVVLWNTSFETIDETDKENVQIDFFKDFLETVGLLKLPLVLFFSLGILLYVYAEQAVNSWLPAFNNKVLLLPDSVSVQLGMIYGGTLAVGRILGGWLIKRFDWFIVLQISLVSALLLLLSVLSLVQDSTTASVQSKLGLPVVAWLLPMIGFFFAPMYPTLSSTILTSVPSHRQSGMTGLIVLFSAFGGSTGSIMTGTLFGWVGGLSALYFLSVPILLLIILLFPYRKQIRNISNRESKPSPRILS